ncbi:MAG: peptidoglycan editing factor PgeF [Hyphomicrobiales bacterium]|nr:polyphenol oxidase [Rhodobiaceae bacterium]OUT81811.1 MAG: hypothetical protein CBB88_06820 [Rhizobiales bacterium TMED28]RZO33705.1 MAG: peptidoglycan editing factor PgeF [Hyphomicrobiales bacterium]|tara:strand:- start:2247 stop:3011 length:765 start_codon:yes stop_codon:yes gene_type:complete
MRENFIKSKGNYLKGCSYGFFTRNGGYSEGIYKSLNCSSRSGDSNINTSKNRTKVLQELDKEDGNLVIPIQKHTNICKIITDKDSQNITADALVTKSEKLILCILTADCVPLLLHEKKENIIGAIHAGWKGAKSNIIENTIIKVQELGGKKENISIVIGPCIQQKSYEVGNEFFENFTLDDKKNRELFIQKSQRYYFDLPQYCINKIKNCGIKKIDNLNKCTYENSNEFFSFRRSLHLNEIDYGRQANAITISK